VFSLLRFTVSVYAFVFSLLLRLTASVYTFVFSLPLRFTASVYTFGIFTLFLLLQSLYGIKINCGVIIVEQYVKMSIYLYLQKIWRWREQIVLNYWYSNLYPWRWYMDSVGLISRPLALVYLKISYGILLVCLS
jgi:hypothetical protein